MMREKVLFHDGGETTEAGSYFASVIIIFNSYCPDNRQSDFMTAV
jgi:hypothetical protein